MGRWTQYDEVRFAIWLGGSGKPWSDDGAQDSCRLPEGMTRIGYDSDTGRYRFRDKDGSIWEGAEGAEYGEMHKGMHDVKLCVHH